MTWKEFVYKQIIAFCNTRGNRTFTLQEFSSAKSRAITSFKPAAKTPFNTVRRVLQELRNDGLISFIDNSGTYTLRGVDILEGEVEDEELIRMAKTPNKKEYLLETYVRDIGWASAAKAEYGLFCMYYDCSNTFLKPNNIPYIEVHHIIPLYQGGEDAIWNLSVLCAHHHRMAHYADEKTKTGVKNTLLEAVKCQQ